MQNTTTEPARPQPNITGAIASLQTITHSVFLRDRNSRIGLILAVVGKQLLRIEQGVDADWLELCEALKQHLSASVATEGLP